MLDPSNRPGADELYTSANNTRDLTVEADSRGAGDVLIAAGWSASRFGAAMLRLHSEWDAAEKPAKPTRRGVEALAEAMQHLPAREALVAATRQAGDWYTRELRLLVGKLKTLPGVREHLTQRAKLWTMADPEVKAAAVLRYWLDQSCVVCEGRKWRLIPGTPALSSRLCHVCSGSGLGAVPHGQEGRRLANYIDDCVSRARQSIKGRLRSTMHRG